MSQCQCESPISFIPVKEGIYRVSGMLEALLNTTDVLLLLSRRLVMLGLVTLRNVIRFIYQAVVVLW